MQDTVIPVITQRHDCHTKVIHESLPLSATHVSRAIEKSAINKNHNVLISDHLTDLKEAFLKRNLESHEAFLEHEALLLCEAARDDHSTAPHNQSSGFWDD